MNKNKGFSLPELLAVIIILSILLAVVVFSVDKYIQKGEKTAFFTSVNNIVNNINSINIIEESDFCMYNYEKNTKNENKLIESMYVLVHKENDKLIYSVYAKSKDKKYIIDAYDFSKLDADNDDLWQEKIENGKSYTYFASKLSGVFDTSEDSKFQNLKNYKICEYVGGKK